MNIFTIFDNKALAYLQPFFSRNIATAIREITAVMSNPDHNFSTHCEDYSLFHIGDYDENTGKINAIAPVHIVNLNELQSIPKVVKPSLPNVKDLENNNSIED